MSEITDKLLNMLRSEALAALADDDPESSCAAHHRVEISVYDSLLKRLHEVDPQTKDARRARDRLGLQIFTRLWGNWYLSAEHDQIWVWPWDSNEESYEKVTPIYRRELEELGWWFDKENDGWSKFV